MRKKETCSRPPALTISGGPAASVEFVAIGRESYARPRYRLDGPPDAARWLWRVPCRVGGPCGQGVRSHGGGVVTPRESTGAGRGCPVSLLPQPRRAPGPGAGPDQLGLSHGQHATAPGREDGPVLAPALRDRELE